jgi:glycerate-2-kinase
VTTRIILDNATATAGAAGEARRLGYDVRTSPLPLTGTARDAGTRIARDARRAAADLRNGDRPVCLVYGGETTVIVKGSGRGGRNQELVLAAAVEIDGEPRITIGSLGTDGIDGPTDAAGAIADGETVARGRRVRLAAAEALADNDSYSYFDATGELIRTGPTGTNVMDVQVALIDPPSS